MATYWTTFRIADDATYTNRYDKMVDAVKTLTNGGKWWVEATSFLLFESPYGIDVVASSIKDAVNPAKDLALIGMPDYKDARVVGATSDADLFLLMPFTKKA